MTYRGHELEELKEMSHDELAEVMDARARRKLERGLRDQEKKLLEDLEKKGQTKTHLRGMIVLPQMVGSTVEIYNGQGFVPVEIEEEMIGHYVGEFAKTRKEVSHSAPGLGATRSSKHVPLK
ncbi:MAG: 30S ribosomal protein S19 [Candidatus Nanohaloarchaea archaeon]